MSFLSKYGVSRNKAFIECQNISRVSLRADLGVFLHELSMSYIPRQIYKSSDLKKWYNIRYSRSRKVRATLAVEGLYCPSLDATRPRETFPSITTRISRGSLGTSLVPFLLFMMYLSPVLEAGFCQEGLPVDTR